MVQNNNKRIAFITGATSGIGEATAKILSDSCNLIICGRRENKLRTLKKDLEDKTNVMYLCFDVRDKLEINKVFKSLPNEWKNIDILINNAGNAHGLDYIDQGNIEDWESMIDINVKGLLFISKEIIKLMCKKKSGHIINVGSIAGKEVYQKGNIYCASKFAVDAISQGMRLDLVDKNIKVSQINPGLVNTGFSLVRFKNNKEKAEKVYEGMKPLKAIDVAECINFILNRPDNVNISELTLLPKAQASSSLVIRKS